MVAIEALEKAYPLEMPVNIINGVPKKSKRTAFGRKVERIFCKNIWTQIKKVEKIY